MNAIWEQVYRQLSGDDGRCVTECAGCYGAGYSTIYEENGVEWDEVCTLCDGHRVVFRDDCDERIGKAVELWVNKLTPKQREENFSGFAQSLQGAYEKAWGNRQGQPWQSDLEEHVRNYVEPVPELTLERLKELLLNRGFRIYVNLYPVSKWNKNGECKVQITKCRDGLPMWDSLGNADTELDALLSATASALEIKS